MSGEKTVRVQWRISGDFDCPHCEEEHDFMAQDEFYVHSKPGESKDFDYEVECKYCKNIIKITGSDY